MYSAYVSADPSRRLVSLSAASFSVLKWQRATAVSEIETSNMFWTHFPNSSGKESSQGPTGRRELPELGVQRSSEQRSAHTKPKVAAA